MRSVMVAALVVAVGGCSRYDGYFVRPDDLAAARPTRPVPAVRADGEPVFIRTDVIVSAQPTRDPRWLKVDTETALPLATGGVISILAGILTATAGMVVGSSTWTDAGDTPRLVGTSLFIVGATAVVVGAIVAIADQFQRRAEVAPR